ncbi:MAG: DUF1254 domain-containing protein, partial [Candidatus Acidiferrales bacterium]
MKYATLANLFSAHRRDVRNISLGKIEQPTGTVTGSDSASAPRKLSQYRRAEDAAFAGSQYLTGYVNPAETFIADPNQDVVYGLGYLSLEKEPVVIQAPDFGDRFWTLPVYDAESWGACPS